MHKVLYSTAFYQPINFHNLLEKKKQRQNVNRFLLNSPSVVRSKDVKFENIYIHFMQLHYYIS